MKMSNWGRFRRFGIERNKLKRLLSKKQHWFPTLDDSMFHEGARALCGRKASGLGIELELQQIPICWTGHECRQCVRTIETEKEGVMS